MEIKTKFNVGDIAYTIYNNSLFQVKIHSINIKATMAGVTCYCIEYYSVEVTDDVEGNIVLNIEFNANELFADKQSLFKHLENTMVEFVEQQ